MEKGEAEPGPARPPAANDNLCVDEASRVDAALTCIAEALGRHLARQHIRERRAGSERAVNDNDGSGHIPPSDS